MNTLDLVKIFDLDNEVDSFVKQSVKSLLGPKAHNFSYTGNHNRCGNDKPHIPHIIGYYTTVRYGELQRFCTGQGGHTPEGDLHIVKRGYSSGSAESAARFYGYWFIEEFPGEKSDNEHDKTSGVPLHGQ